MSILVTVISISSLFACLFVMAMAAYRQFYVYTQTRDFYEEQKNMLSLRISQISDPVNAVKNNAGHIAWNGYRKFLLKGKVLEAEGICSFYFAPIDKKPLPPYIPGQYLTFQIQTPDSKKEVVRCYSLSDSPNHPDYYRITVKKLEYKTQDGQEKQGLISNYFHNQLQSDDIIDVKAPSGHFYLDTDSNTPVVLIGGGIGVTPVLSMLNYLVQSKSTREIWFFYGVRNSNEHIMIDHFSELDKEIENLKVQVCYSNPLDEDEQYVDYDHAERVSVDLFKRVLPSNNYEYYICGPAPLMDSITNDLQQWGVPEDKINFEAFGPSTVKKVASEEAVSAAKMTDISINFARSESELAWDGQSDSILEFAEKHEIPLDSGCRSGNCGSCRVSIRSGDVEYLSPPGATVDDGACLACISVPRNNLVLDL